VSAVVEELHVLGCIAHAVNKFILIGLEKNAGWGVEVGLLVAAGQRRGRSKMHHLTGARSRRFHSVRPGSRSRILLACSRSQFRRCA